MSLVARMKGWLVFEYTITPETGADEKRNRTWGFYPPIWRKTARVMWLRPRVWHVVLECGHVSRKRFLLVREPNYRCCVCEAIRAARAPAPTTWVEGDRGEPLPDHLFVTHVEDDGEGFEDASASVAPVNRLREPAL